MEEDIKRIKCLIERCKQCKLNACITCDICWSEVQAIENLINKNKELEEASTFNYECYQDIGKTYFDLTEKIENKIKEYKEKEKCKNGKYCNNCCTYYARCKMLQELLKE